MAVSQGVMGKSKSFGRRPKLERELRDAQENRWEKTVADILLFI